MLPALDFLEGHRLEVYSTDWCPDCRRLERWLREHGIETEEVNIDSDPLAGELLESETGKRGVPYVRIDGQVWVRGYHRERRGRFDPLLLVEELREAISG
jgi:glutaredoxin